MALSTIRTRLLRPAALSAWWRAVTAVGAGAAAGELLEDQERVVGGYEAHMSPSDQEVVVVRYDVVEVMRLPVER